MPGCGCDCYSGYLSRRNRMPWQGTLFAFNARTVMASGPRTSGVYALWRNERWIYIGQSANIYERLLEHLGGDEDCVARERPTGFGFELIADAAGRLTRQGELVRELAPVCNLP
jgi:hypothetical protein